MHTLHTSQTYYKLITGKYTVRSIHLKTNSYELSIIPLKAHYSIKLCSEPFSQLLKSPNHSSYCTTANRRIVAQHLLMTGWVLLPLFRCVMWHRCSHHKPTGLQGVFKRRVIDSHWILALTDGISDEICWRKNKDEWWHQKAMTGLPETLQSYWQKHFLLLTRL